MTTSASARAQMVERILTVSATEKDLQKLAYASKGLADLTAEEIIASIPSDYYYGVSWDESLDTFTPVGSAAKHLALPIQSRMRRCLVNDAGEPTHFLHPLNSNYYDDGSPADLSGASGQVMVQIPKFWYSYSYVGTTHTYLLSEVPLPGFGVYPAFLKNGVEVDFRYTSAYEASVASGKIRSASGVYPTTSQTRAQFRAAAVARGAGWRQLDYFLHSAALTLAFVEFKTFDFKTASRLTAGRTALSGGSWAPGSYIALTGLSNALGNRTGGVSLGGTAGIPTDYMSYRGIENLFGHVSKFVDGLTVDGTANNETTPMPFWVTNNDAYFADSGSSNMVKLCDATNLGATNDGYIATIMPNLAAGFIPGSVGASSTTKARAYYWQYPDNNNNWRAPCVGGYAANGALAAPLSLSVFDPASSSVVTLGARAGF